jgi:hypothetical protein
MYFVHIDFVHTVLCCCERRRFITLRVFAYASFSHQPLHCTFLHRPPTSHLHLSVIISLPSHQFYFEPSRGIDCTFIPFTHTVLVFFFLARLFLPVFSDSESAFRQRM